MKFIFVDAMGLVFRAYHAMSKMDLQAPNGEPTGAVFGFGNLLSTMLTKEKPDYVCVAFDTPAPTFRHERFEAYKAHRPEFPQELVPQLARIKEMVRLLNLSQVESPGYEADDIIGTMAGAAANAGFDVFCLTSDKDYCQLVSDRVKLLRPGFSMGEYELVDIAGVEAKFGVKPSQVVDVLALLGDASDNVPGVKGIGEKTGIPLIQQFGSVEALYDNLANVSKDAVRKKLEADREMAFLSKELVTIHTSVPLDLTLDECVRREPDTERLREFFHLLGFRSMLGKFVKESAKESAKAKAGTSPQTSTEAASAEQDSAAQTTTPLATIADTPHEYVLADTPEKIEAMLRELRADLQTPSQAPPQAASQGLLAFDCETTSLDTMRCEIVGMSFAAREGRAFYVPFDVPFDMSSNSPSNELPDITTSAASTAHQASLFDAPSVARVASAASAPLPQTAPELASEHTSHNLPLSIHAGIAALLQDPQVVKCGQNAKFDALILRRYGVDVSPIGFDTMLASYVLNPDALHGMDALAQKWLQYSPVPISTLIGTDKKTQISMRDVAVERVADYAAEDADVTLKLAHKLRSALQQSGQLAFAESVEFASVEVLTTMESNGVAIDSKALSGIQALLAENMASLKTRIFAETAKVGVAEFNVDSPKQLGEILFETMGIPPVKKTKSGYSTDASVLEELAAQHPIAGFVLDYRQMAKLQSTYVESLPRLINAHTQRVHTTFNMTATGTGRLSSSEPNLQNIPVRTELGREIRKAFVAGKPDHTLLSADYSQIELRIMAHICGDETLVDAFQHGRDIHAATASNLFSVPASEVSRDQRRIAKTVNFGVMYGQGSFGLAQQLGVSRSEAKEVIDNYFAKYPRIKEYIDSTIAQTRERGYTSTLLGRRKQYPDITSTNRQARTASERAAINMPIQGTAADMMKLAMAAIYRAMKRDSMRSLMLLQIHDELIFEVHPSERETLPPLVQSCMESAFSLGAVPVVAELGFGNNWAEAH
jgi:DNA polymerase I